MKDTAQSHFVQFLAVFTTAHSSIFAFACRSSIKEAQVLNASYIHYFLEKVKAAKRIKLKRAVWK